MIETEISKGIIQTYFNKLEKNLQLDVAIVGGKSSSLGEMTAKTDVPVPYGYATTAYAYRYFIEKTGLKQKMADLIAQLTDVENTALLRDISAKLRKAIMDEEYGVMIGIVNGKIKRVPLAECAGKLKMVSAKDQTVKAAKQIGISFGD